MQLILTSFRFIEDVYSAVSKDPNKYAGFSISYSVPDDFERYTGIEQLKDLAPSAAVFKLWKALPELLEAEKKGELVWPKGIPAYIKAGKDRAEQAIRADQCTACYKFLSQKKLVEGKDAFRDDYLQQLAYHPAGLKKLVQALRSKKAVFVMCWEATAGECHRLFLARFLMRRLKDLKVLKLEKTKVVVENKEGLTSVMSPEDYWYYVSREDTSQEVKEQFVKDRRVRLDRPYFNYAGDEEEYQVGISGVSADYRPTSRDLWRTNPEMGSGWFDYDAAAQNYYDGYGFLPQGRVIDNIVKSFFARPLGEIYDS